MSEEHQSTVRFVQDGAVGTVTLDSPPLNLIGQQLISDLLAAFDQVDAAQGLRALVLQGEGNVFSAGARVVGMGGDLHAAEEFAAWGVIDRVVARAELRNAATEFAQRLAAGPTHAFSVVKDLVRAYTTAGVMGADSLLTDAAVGLFDTEDARRGIESFLTSGPGHATFAGR